MHPSEPLPDATSGVAEVAPADHWKKDRRRLAALSLFWLLSAAFFWRPLFHGEILIPLNPRSWHPWGMEDPGWQRKGSETNPLMMDALTLTHPWRLYNSDLLSRGEMPFWNPYIFAGYPHLAALQSHAVYPLAAVFDLWDPVAGIAWSMALHLGLAGTLMFLFLCRLRVGLAAATLGGVLFELNGFFLVRMSAPSYVFTGIWAPLVLIGFDDLIRRGDWRSSWKIVLAACFSLLGGHPQIFVLIMLIGGGYALLRAWPLLHQVSPRALAGRFVQLALAVALGVGLAGAQLLPFLELVGETARSPIDFSSYRKLALPPAVLGQALVPDAFGHPVDRSYWLLAAERYIDAAPEAQRVWGWNYCGENLFTGVAPLVLAFFALIRLRSPVALYFGALAAFSLLVVFGAPGVLRLVYELVPTFQHSRSDRIIYVYMLALSVLAPLGWAGATGWRAAKEPPRVASWLARALIVLPVMPALLQTLLSAEKRDSYRRFLAFARDQASAQSDVLVPQAIEAVVIALAAAGLLVAVGRWPHRRALAWSAALVLIVVPLCRFGWRFNPVQKPPLFPASPVIERLRQEVGELDRMARVGAAAFPSNIGQTLGLFDVHGSSAAALAPYVRLVQAADARAVNKQKYFRRFHDSAVLESPLLDYLGAGLILGGPSLPLPQLADFPAGLAFRVYRNPQRLPRFFLVDRVEPYRTAEEGVRRFLSPEFEPGRVALVESSDAGVLAEREDPPDGRIADTVNVVSYGAHSIELEVKAAGERLLVSSEVDYPGWEVEIDGARQPKVLVNTAFRGVRVTAGEHRVRFHFIPRSFVLGLGLTILCAVIFLASLLRAPMPSKPQRSLS